MSSTLPPRAVVVRRPTEYELLLGRHATRGQAAFFLKSRGQDLNAVEAEHARMHAALTSALTAIPAAWHRSVVLRDDLHRFLFEDRDVVIAVGQDGLVANIAKYVASQPVLGVNPLPQRYDGVLARFAPEAVADALARMAGGHEPLVQPRTMVEAKLDDGQTLIALNELFVGHRSHQSARYRIRWSEREERHSSSGVIVTTGTGATGWARSVNLARANRLELPKPVERAVAFFVREAFPSKATGTSLVAGTCAEGLALELVSEMNDGGVIFGDGIEDDHLGFGWGQRLTIGVASRTLQLVVG
jgi:hypothetical protein